MYLKIKLTCQLNYTLNLRFADGTDVVWSHFSVIRVKWR